MLRRKNPDIQYIQPHGNTSPYRFERKNPNISPGLSPMRCRTPTRSNLSPFRGNSNNGNLRGHSPIKFVSGKITTPLTNGFFRTQNPSHHPSQYSQKYATCNPNNDHSIKRQSYYENPNNSKINVPYENTQRSTMHENTKLFSKLVEKLNSQKKKQPELARRNTKPEVFKAHEISQIEQKASDIQKLTRQKSQTQHTNFEPIVDHIKPVESVVYEQKQTKTYFQNQQYTYGKQNMETYHEQTYKFKQVEKPYVVPLETAKYNNLKVQRMEEKQQIQQKAQPKIERPTTPTKQEVKEEIRKDKPKSGKKEIEKGQSGSNLQNQDYKINDAPKKAYNFDDPNGYDDIQMLLDKLNYVPKDEPMEVKESLGNFSVKDSLNMDPYL